MMNLSFFAPAQPVIAAQQESAQLADGADVARFVNNEVQVNGVAFVEFRALLKAGHAAHPQCYVA